MRSSADRHPPLLLQLPLNPSAPLEATGNVPLAPAALAAAADLPVECLLDQSISDSLGDRALVSLISEREPRLVAFTLYMWNAERSAWMARRLKEAMDPVVIVGGGPEVTPDNDWLRECGSFDLLVSGEGEEVASRVLDPLKVKRTAAGTGGFLRTGEMDFPPGTYPNPWLSGYLDPTSTSVQVETVRGCPGTCSYCAYRRTSPVPRLMEASRALELIRRFRGKAGEVVFLDPTFNARPDLDVLLSGMKGTGLSFFGEMWGDIITPSIAEDIHDAGFRSVEIGLQSCSDRVLSLSGRNRDPERVLEGAMNLRNAGVTPVLDMILGLPGDTPEEAVRTAMMIRDRALHHHLQVFYLSLLPGTVLRTGFRGRWMERPPYYFSCDPEMEGYAAAREEIADIAGYDLDLAARPLLFDGWKGTRTIDLESDAGAGEDMPSYRHGSLRLVGDDLWKRRESILRHAGNRREADPFCVLDVVLVPGREFPLDLIEMIRSMEEPRDYSGRTAGVLGRDGNLRITVLVQDPQKFNMNWLLAASETCTLALDRDHPSLMPEELWRSGALVRLAGTGWDMAELSSSVPSMHQVAFRERRMEEEWTRSMDL